MRDERICYNAQNRQAARIDANFQYLSDRLQEISKVEFKSEHTPIEINSDNDLLIIVSDCHLGLTFDSSWGSYNLDIAKDRLDQLLGEVKKIQARHNSANAFISIQGDIISGSIHKTLAITNRENAIDQVKAAVELLSSFILEISKTFSHVYVTNVSGNHTRMDKKDEALHDERLDDLIGWTIKRILANVPNVEVLDKNIDIGIARMNIRGKDYINVHGDYDAFTKNGIANLCMMLGYIPYAVTFGHLHTCTVDESQGVKMIRGGSLCGSGDAYTIEKRLKGKPAQMVCVCNTNGVECFYPIELK